MDVFIMCIVVMLFLLFLVLMLFTLLAMVLSFIKNIIDLPRTYYYGYFYNNKIELLVIRSNARDIADEVAYDFFSKKQHDYYYYDKSELSILSNIFNKLKSVFSQ